MSKKKRAYAYYKQKGLDVIVGSFSSDLDIRNYLTQFITESINRGKRYLFM